MTPCFSALFGTARPNGEKFFKIFPGRDLVVKIPPGRQQNPSENPARYPARYADKYISLPTVSKNLLKYRISYQSILKGSK